MSLLDVDRLEKTYPGQRKRAHAVNAVRGVSFKLDRGRTLGLVGESGCGKSTTARLVLGLTAPSAGAVRLDGAPVRSVRDAAWREQRRRMQLVYQNPLAALDRRVRVGEQVTEPLVIQGLVADRASREARAVTAFEIVGLRPDLLVRYPHELSGGQRQRVILARALVLDPDLLVCDEPVSALDVSVAAQVVTLLQDLQKRRGTAMLFISHDLKVVRQIADDIAVMYAGRIVEQGPCEAVLRAPLHPYAQALVSTVATTAARDKPRPTLSGEPPNPSAIPAGCAFHTRCPHAFARCRVDDPALSVAPDGRLAACHLVPSSGLKAAA